MVVIVIAHTLLCLCVSGTYEEIEAHREVKNIVLGHSARTERFRAYALNSYTVLIFVRTLHAFSGIR